IFDGLRWLDLGWDEQYRQSERLAVHQETAQAIFHRGLAYRDFTPADTGPAESARGEGTWLFNADMRELSAAESDRRAAAGEPFVLRFRVPRDQRALSRRRLRRTDQIHGRYRGLRAVAQQWHADVPPGILRGRRRPAHQ